MTLKKDEKKPITWEVADPKPPIVQSGHMESRRENAGENRNTDVM